MGIGEIIISVILGILVLGTTGVRLVAIWRQLSDNQDLRHPPTIVRNETLGSPRNIKRDTTK